MLIVKFKHINNNKVIYLNIIIIINILYYYSTYNISYNFMFILKKIIDFSFLLIFGYNIGKSIMRMDGNNDEVSE